MLRKCLALFILCLFATASVNAQYKPTWESLDKKPVPEWYKDAKFGIFIHWGVYSVPAYSKVGGYAEWYQHKLRSKPDGAVAQYHQAVYGDQSYYDLAKYFTAELFDPEAWTELFKKAGAKYVVLTSKHHDGFTLWPSKVADKHWDVPWTAAQVGPHQDLIGALFSALRETDIKPGLYYSLYEWYNPVYKNRVDFFVVNHTIPQMKYLINQYEPYLLWTDGGWDHSAETWHAKEFLAWLYNESPVQDSIVTYDRWGGGVRFHHGMVYTPEYEPGLTFGGHYFEESQGMGYSYGYNRAEDVTDYSSARVLILQLIDIVSRGGNFLLDIGPRADGKIPPIMQERLLQIGQWLSVNGEAIYGTRPWKVHYQWSEGKRNYEAKEGETLLLKQTINPKAGYATKEIFFTHKGDNLYCILPEYPEHILTVNDINLSQEAVVTLLATGQQLAWENTGENLQITIPPFDPDKVETAKAYVVKIANAPRLVSKPDIEAEYKSFTASPVIKITSKTSDVKVHYTLDGSQPDKSDPLYTEPFKLEQTKPIKAVAFKEGWVSSKTDSTTVEEHDWYKNVAVTNPQQGVQFHYYELENLSLKAIEGADVVKEGVTSAISLDEKMRKDKFAFSFTGYIKINESGVYTFYTASDDGSDLWIDGTQVVDNGGPHGVLQKSGSVALKEGFHKIKIRYYDGGGNHALEVSMQAKGGAKKPIPASMLYH